MARLMLHQMPHGTTAWYWVDCYCGFEVYANLAGMHRIDGVDEPQRRRSGDWLGVMYRPALHEEPALTKGLGNPIGRIEIQDSLPVRTIPTYWCGRTALEHHEGPRAVVDIYRLP